MSRAGLTEDEERHILLLLEGDVSDVDIGSDDEEDEDNIVLPNIDSNLLTENLINDIVNNNEEHVIQLPNNLFAEIELRIDATSELGFSLCCC
ncbi:hypothetical protein MTP99_005933 [Tenebrio molitor]|jgi:hypothetical protein|nr:hypothetical protein MTP99_005933 [Tenebrio molitor]